MSEKIELRETIRAFYSIFLDRNATEEEVVLYERGYSNGLTITEIGKLISESKEANSIRLRNILKTTTVSEAIASGLSLTSSILVAVDDLMNSISEVYEAAVGRHPAFAEVYERFAALKAGQTLTATFKSINTCEEAVSFRDVRTERKIEEREEFKNTLAVLYKEFFERSIFDEEVDIWLSNHIKGMSIAAIVSALSTSEEASSIRSLRNFSAWPKGQFVQFLFEILLDQGASVSDIKFFCEKLRYEDISPQALLRQFFLDAIRRLTDPPTNHMQNDPTVAHLFGAVKRLATMEEWENRFGQSVENSTSKRDAPAESRRYSRFPYHPSNDIHVSIITSMYKGGDFIDKFLDNIVSQSIFKKSELIIIDSDSPDGESVIIKKFQKRFSNIIYKRYDTRIGIYQAWNWAVENARGRYCTNANLDDCRREDSLELQASTLDALPFVDVVYQDVLYGFQSNIFFSDYQRCGFATSLPIISRYNLMEFNSPHNAPMWRRSLHDQVGFFDGSLQSAGDFDFWLRCHLAGKTFFKINDPHVAYYVNPNGLSTRSDTRGGIEAAMVAKKYYRRLVSDNLTCDDEQFKQILDGRGGESLTRESRYDQIQTALRRLSVESRGIAS